MHYFKGNACTLTLALCRHEPRRGAHMVDSMAQKMTKKQLLIATVALTTTVFDCFFFFARALGRIA